MENITLDLQLEEVNIILSAMGNLPYVQVFGLIEKIKSQAGAQIQSIQNQVEEAPEKELAHA